MSIFEKTKAKNIISNQLEITNIVCSALDKMATVVQATLGPGGRCVLIERDGLSPLVTKDGVTVAKNLGVSNAERNIIIESAKEICLNTAKEAGDGTTTAIVLANALTKHGTEFLNKNPKYNPQRMVNELNDLYKKVIVPFLEKNSKKIKSNDELINVAAISANGDRAIAESVVEAVLAAGQDGHVLIEEAQGGNIRVETMDGFIVTTGLKELGAIGRAFINDRTNQQVKMDNGIVFLYDGTVNDLKVPAAIQSAIEGSELYGCPIIVFAHDFADIVLEKFAQTTKQGYTVLPVKTPRNGLANSRSMFLLDMAAYSGASIYNPSNIDSFIEKEGKDGFGKFDTAKINMYESLITNACDTDKIDQRVNELKSILTVTNSDFDKMHIKAAIGKLIGGISTIWVGGASELEAREKKARVEDAVEAVKSAIAEGIIPGGCAVHLSLINLINSHADRPQSWSIMLNALTAPFFALMSNCGEDPQEIYTQMSSFTKSGLPSKVFDAYSHSFVDPFVVGIIEPTKVCRVSLGNALSVASLLITLGGIVVVPRDSQLENQLALSKQAFTEMMGTSTGLMGQE